MMSNKDFIPAQKAFSPAPSMMMNLTESSHSFILGRICLVILAFKAFKAFGRFSVMIPISFFTWKSTSCCGGALEHILTLVFTRHLSNFIYGRKPFLKRLFSKKLLSLKQFEISQNMFNFLAVVVQDDADVNLDDKM